MQAGCAGTAGMVRALCCPCCWWIGLVPGPGVKQGLGLCFSQSLSGRTGLSFCLVGFVLLCLLVAVGFRPLCGLPAQLFHRAVSARAPRRLAVCPSRSSGLLSLFRVACRVLCRCPMGNFLEVFRCVHKEIILISSEQDQNNLLRKQICSVCFPL